MSKWLWAVKILQYPIHIQVPKSLQILTEMVLSLRMCRDTRKTVLHLLYTKWQRTLQMIRLLPQISKQAKKDRLPPLITMQVRQRQINLLSAVSVTVMSEAVSWKIQILMVLCSSISSIHFLWPPLKSKRNGTTKIMRFRSDLRILRINWVFTIHLQVQQVIWVVVLLVHRHGEVHWLLAMVILRQNHQSQAINGHTPIQSCLNMMRRTNLISLRWQKQRLMPIKNPNIWHNILITQM